MPFAIALISVWRVETAKRITEVVRSLVNLTSITGITPERALIVFDFASSAIDSVFEAITLSKALVIKISVSISTLVVVSINSFSNSSVIALK